MLSFKQFCSRRRRYEDLSVSIREHLQEKVEDLMEQGMSREEATFAARRDFGNAACIGGKIVGQFRSIESDDRSARRVFDLDRIEFRVALAR